MIRAIALDDEPPALKVIENFCARVDGIRLEKTFTQPNEALKYLHKFPVDLIFLDIQMPSVSGIEFYKKIQQQTMIIFTTAYSEYAVEGFNLNATDYLLKPFTFERFRSAVAKAGEYHQFHQQAPRGQDNFIFLRADLRLVKINTADILYIQGLDDYLQVFLDNQKTVTTRMTMKSILSKLPETEFIRVHRSFIVPISRIESIRNKVITIAGQDISIGTTYEEIFFQKLKGTTE